MVKLFAAIPLSEFVMDFRFSRLPVSPGAVQKLKGTFRLIVGIPQQET